MKTVHNTRNVCHLWANKAQDHARNSGNSVYFHGETIFSYGSHFPIARHHESGYVLFTTRTASVTTSTHIHACRMACLHLPRIDVPDVLPNSAHEHAENITERLQAIADTYGKAERARSHGDRYCDEAAAIIADVRNYVENVSGIAPLAHLDPEAAGRYAQYIEGANESEVAGRVAEIERKAKAEAVRKAKRERRKRASDLQDWREHKRPYAEDPTGHHYAYLRISSDGQRVETTQGASVTVKEAQDIATLIRFGRPIHGRTIGGYTVTGWNGTMKIGCHTIPRAEVLNMAEQLKGK